MQIVSYKVQFMKIKVEITMPNVPFFCLDRGTIRFIFHLFTFYAVK